MAFYHRKFLVVSRDKVPEDDEGLKSYCYSCYDCSDECNKYLPPPPPSPKHHISTALILSLCVLGAAFLFLSYFAIHRYLSRRRRNSPPLEIDNFREDFIDELQGPVIDHPIWFIRTIGLPQSVINSIAVFKYKKGEGLIEGSDCSVCLSEFQEDESLRLLPKCSHAFHLPCIDTWLRSHQNCPVCRAPVMISSENQVNSVETSSNDSVSTEENQVESEVETDESGEIRNIGAEISSARNGSFRVQSDLADHRVKVDQELEPVRRSVSMDFSSASTIYQAVANIHAKKDEGSCNSTLFQGPVSMNRSF